MCHNHTRRNIIIISVMDVKGILQIYYFMYITLETFRSKSFQSENVKDFPIQYFFLYLDDNDIVTVLFGSKLRRYCT